MNDTVSPRREAWQRLLGGMLFRILILLLILYTVYHCVLAASPRMTTSVVTVGEEHIVTEGEATLFRDERVLTVDGQGMLISYPLENGAKVSASSTLATLYVTALDAPTLAELQARLNRLDHQIVALDRAQRQSASTLTNTGTTSLAGIHTDIREQILILSRTLTSSGTSREGTDALARLQLLLDRYAALTGAEVSAVTPMETLTSQRSALVATVARSTRTMTMHELVVGDGEEGLSSFSGYFYHADAVDGYETVFSRSALATMNIVDYDAMHRAVQTEYTGRTLLGKLVGSYTWSIAVPVAFEITDKLTVGEQYSVSFSQGVTLPMTLDRVIRSVGDGRAVLVLTSDDMPAGFSYTRFQSVQLVLETVRGYRVPDTALHTSDTGEFVYILRDGSVRARSVRVLLRGEGYVLVEIPDQKESEGLSLHDVVITSGKDLYDGKYID